MKTFIPAGRPIGDKKLRGNTISFTTGRIGETNYAMHKDGSVRNITESLNKKQRKKTKRAYIDKPGGHTFRCQCKAVTYHFPSSVMGRMEGYEDVQKIDTYECCICGAHAKADVVNDALARAKAAAEAALPPQP